jgi:hypothetical protein
VVDDLDGNQLFFNYPSETASGKIAGDEAWMTRSDASPIS